MGGQRFRPERYLAAGVALGSMHGSYFCVTEDAKFFDVVIPPFSLKAEGLGPKRDAAAVLH